MVSENARRLREEKRLTLDEAARLTGVSRSMLAQIEKGDVNPTISMVWKIANGYKVSFTSLVEPARERPVLLRGDDQSRAAFLSTMIEHGILNPDEARALEERAPIPGGWGQTFFITKNLGSMESVAKGEPTNG